MREYLEVDGKFFVPAWALAQFPEGEKKQIIAELKKKYRLTFSNQHHGWLCSNNSSDVNNYCNI